MTVQFRDDSLQGYHAALNAYQKGKYQEAIVLLNGELEHNPQAAASYNLLGICFLCVNDMNNAARTLRKAISIEPRSDFYSNLGMVLAKMDNLEAAAEAYQSALELEPDTADICTNYANVLSSRGQLEQAIALYRRALSIDPNYLSAHSNMALALCKADRAEEAFPSLQATGALGALQFEMRKRAYWMDLTAIDSSCIQQISNGTFQPANPWCLLYVPGMTPDLEMKAARQFAMTKVAGIQAPQLCGHKHIEAGGRPLRIGYLSSDFHNHATMHLLAGVLEKHSRKTYEIVLFSYGPTLEDEYTTRIRATGWPRIDIGQMSDSQAAAEILAQEIDILVDLNTFTRSARLGITEMRPAPIIVNWLGHAGTLGYQRLADYIIGDSVVTPIEEAPFYSERLALMPHSYQPNDDARVFPEASSRAEAGLPDEALVFCSFNQVMKFNAQLFDIWARLITAVRNSVIWLDLRIAEPKQNILKEFVARGIAEERVIFAPFVPQKEHLARLRLADIALDTFPCNSHTTGSDALWAGIPLVTLKGKTFSSRVAESLLTAHGFQELVTDSADGYFNLALELATNHHKRAVLKERLVRARTTSPLFDTTRFTKDLERLYEAMVENHNRREELRAPVIMLD